MSVKITPCKRCIGGQVINGVCVQCGAEHDKNGRLLVDESVRQAMARPCFVPETAVECSCEYYKRFQHLGDNGLPYGNGCFGYGDCFSLTKGCVAGYRGSKSRYEFKITHQRTG
jgi:hypothetical protein